MRGLLLADRMARSEIAQSRKRQAEGADRQEIQAALLSAISANTRAQLAALPQMWTVRQLAERWAMSQEAVDRFLRDHLDLRDIPRNRVRVPVDVVLGLDDQVTGRAR